MLVARTCSVRGGLKSWLCNLKAKTGRGSRFGADAIIRTDRFCCSVLVLVVEHFFDLFIFLVVFGLQRFFFAERIQNQ